MERELAVLEGRITDAKDELKSKVRWLFGWSSLFNSEGKTSSHLPDHPTICPSKQVQPKYEAAKAAKEAVEAEKGQAELVINELHAKQGRGSQYETVEERDAFLNGQLESLDESIRQKEALILKTEQKVRLG